MRVSTISARDAEVSRWSFSQERVSFMRCALLVFARGGNGRGSLTAQKGACAGSRDWRTIPLAAIFAAMTAEQTRILDLFRALTPAEREALLPQLVGTLDSELSSDALTPEEDAAIREGLDQMRRGETITGDELFGRLATRFGFTRA